MDKVKHSVHLPPSDVFQKGVWPDLMSIQDPELRELAESLPSVVLHSKAPSTVKKYSGAFNRWKRWASSKPALEVFPAKPFQVALYLSFLIHSARTSSHCLLPKSLYY